METRYGVENLPLTETEYVSIFDNWEKEVKSRIKIVKEFGIDPMAMEIDWDFIQQRLVNPRKVIFDQPIIQQRIDEKEFCYKRRELVSREEKTFNAVYLWDSNSESQSGYDLLIERMEPSKDEEGNKSKPVTITLSKNFMKINRTLIRYDEIKEFKKKGPEKKPTLVIGTSTDEYTFKIMPKEKSKSFEKSFIVLLKSFSLLIRHPGAIIWDSDSDQDQSTCLDLDLRLWTHSFGKHGFLRSVTGKIYAFGFNKHGQLGLHDYLTRWFPVPHPFFSEEGHGRCVDQISVGGFHTLFLVRENEPVVYSVGDCEFGQTCVGIQQMHTTICDLTPVDDLGGLKIDSVFAGWAVSYFLCSDGECYSSGMGKNGMLGTGKWKNECFPYKVLIDVAVDDVSVGYSYAVFQTLDLCVFISGQFLDLKFNTCTPVLMENLLDQGIKSVKSGARFSVFLTEEKRLFFLGSLMEKQHNRPIVIGENIARVVTGLDHIFIETTDRKLMSLGESCVFGRLGRKSKNSLKLGSNKMEFLSLEFDSETPTDVTELFANCRNSYVLTESGKLFACGSSRFGQLFDCLKSQPVMKDILDYESHFHYLQALENRVDAYRKRHFRDFLEIPEDQPVEDLTNEASQITSILSEIKAKMIFVNDFFTKKYSSTLCFNGYTVFVWELEPMVVISKSIHRKVRYLGQMDGGKVFDKYGKLIYCGEWKDGEWNGYGREFRGGVPIRDGKYEMGNFVRNGS